ncbi:hypothetical protein MUN77_03090 [Leucobacter allii]|uniref:hypothetical protein n=1 Tax=Leucobacter allii TaxID=2932247 RepID=UPI001FD30A46|nr:hypothetical protein [Leucobacter allii]UOR02323.1 hypothetical protein MUN77_03090 [Leucobacter allii]
MTITSRTRFGLILTTGVLGLGALALSGCSASDATASDDTAGDSAATAQEEAGPRGVSGEIALVDGDVLQVQDSDSQTAVAFGDDTAITAEVAAALSDVVEGVCVSAVSGSDDSSAATSITITDAVDGSCAGGMGGGFGGAGGGTPPEGGPEAASESGAPADGAPADGEMPEMPQDGADGSGEAPEGMPEGGFGGFTGGLVTAVSGSTITVESTAMGMPGADGADGDADTGADAAEAETETVELTVDDATAYTKTVDADSSALVVGACVTAQGEYADEGFVASAIAVSEAGEDGCSTGFGGMGGGRPGQDQGQNQTAGEDGDA